MKLDASVITLFIAVFTLYIQIITKNTYSDLTWYEKSLVCSCIVDRQNRKIKRRVNL